MRNSIFLLSLNFLFITLSIAQESKLRKADIYFEKLSYKTASRYYSDLLNSSLDNPQMKAKLAFCYYQMGDLLNSEKYYSDAINKGQVDGDNYFYFAQVLKQLGKNQESDRAMDIFASKLPNDKRSKSFLSNRDYLNKINNQEVHFTIQNTAINSEFSDFGGYQSDAENALYFLSSRKKSLIQRDWMWNGQGFLDLFFVDSSKNSKPQLFKKVSSKFHEGPICFSPDKSRVYITKNNIYKVKNDKEQSGIRNIRLVIADVDSTGNWINLRESSLNSNDFSIGHPTISADGKTIYFVSDMPGGYGGADLYMANIDSTGDLGKPMNLGSLINTEGQEMFPWASPDGLLYFSSNGHIGLGGLDVFVTPIDADREKFSEIRNVGKPLNSQFDDFALIFNRDGETGYFSSNRTGGKGNDDIYGLNLIKPFVFKMNLKGVVIDDQTQLALSGSTVFLMDENQSLIDSLVADEFGSFSFDVKPDKKYTIIAKSSDYSSGQQDIFMNSSKGKTIDLIVELTKIPKIGLIGTIRDTKTNLFLEDVSIIIKDKTSKQEIFNGKTGQNGDFLTELSKNRINDQLNFVITISKTGYLTKEIDFEYRIEKAGLINISEMLDISIGKVDLGVDLAKLIEIKPIYFDKGKYIIRKDAAIELDKIVKIMNEYPTMELELGSHTDCRSSIASNLKLSYNRAKASAEYIKKQISNPQRIYGKGYGESKLIVDCPCEGKVKSNCSEEDHQKNRRTEFIVLKM